MLDTNYNGAQKCQNGKFIKCPPTSRWKWDITWANGERCLENLFSKIVTTCSIRPLASSTRVGEPNFLTTTKTSLSEYSVLLYLKEKDLIFAKFNFFQLTWWNYHPRSWQGDHPTEKLTISSWFPRQQWRGFFLTGCWAGKCSFILLASLHYGASPFEIWN